jgi:hypothetical protein
MPVLIPVLKALYALRKGQTEATKTLERVRLDAAKGVKSARNANEYAFKCRIRCRDSCRSTRKAAEREGNNVRKAAGM